MPLSFSSSFKPSWWCLNPHLQTIWPFLFRTAPSPAYRRERLELDDGDFIDLDWLEPTQSAPIVVVLHGLGGDSQSHYVRGLVTELARVNIRSVVLHHRGCSGEPNRLPRSYHAGDSQDIDFLLRRFKAAEPQTPLFAVGYSLGASMLLNWLNENRSLLVAACVVSTPFELAVGADRMEHGLSRIYQNHLVSRMKDLLRQKTKTVKLPLDTSTINTVRTFREFDNLVTAPLHGFKDAEDYYSRCSTRKTLSGIRIPTLVIHAADDPLMTVEAIPREGELSDAIFFELSRHGGHCGFVSGGLPTHVVYWAEERIVKFLSSFLPKL